MVGVRWVSQGSAVQQTEVSLISHISLEVADSCSGIDQFSPQLRIYPKLTQIPA